MESWATAILETPEEPLLMVRNGMCRAILFSKSWGNLKIKAFCTAGQPNEWIPEQQVGQCSSADPS